MSSTELEFLTETPIGGEIYYDEFTDAKKVWKVMLYNVLNPTVRKNWCGRGNYIIFKAKLMEGFDKYNLDLNYDIYFSLASFRRAWVRAKRNNAKLDLDKMYDCIMTFMRPNKKKMEILHLEFIELVFDEDEYVYEY